MKKKIYDLHQQQVIDHITKSWPELSMFGIDNDFLLEKLEKDPKYFETLSERAQKEDTTQSKIPKSAGVIRRVDSNGNIIKEENEDEKKDQEKVNEQS